MGEVWTVLIVLVCSLFLSFETVIKAAMEGVPFDFTGEERWTSQSLPTSWFVVHLGRLTVSESKSYSMGISTG